MPLYNINDQIRQEIVTMCDFVLKSQGLSAHNIVLNILSTLSRPINLQEIENQAIERYKELEISKNDQA